MNEGADEKPTDENTGTKQIGHGIREGTAQKGEDAWTRNPLPQERKNGIRNDARRTVQTMREEDRHLPG